MSQRHLQKHQLNLIRPKEYAFRCGHSMTLQLLNLVNNLSINFNKKAHTAAVFRYVKKAYNQVWLEILIQKMASFSRPILADISKGFCLGSILYIIITNDIPIQVNSNMSLFADDMMFYLSNQNSERAILQLQRKFLFKTDWFKKLRQKI